MKKVVKLTTEMLKTLVKEESEKLMKERADLDKNLEDAHTLKLGKSDEADEVDADEYADTLEKKIDWYKANKIKEAKLVRALAEVRKQGVLMKKKIAETL